MKFLRTRKDDAEAPSSATPNGRPLLFYFLPVVAAAVIAMALLVVFSLQESNAVRTQAAESGARSAALALAGRVAGEVRAQHEALGVVARFASVQKALREDEDEALGRTALAVERLVPGLIQLRLFAQGKLQPDPTGKAPLSFAGVDMVRRALRGEEVPVEIHHIDAGSPYLAVARPVRLGSEVIGVVLGAWALDKLSRLDASVDGEHGERWLMQGGVRGFRITAAAAAPEPPLGTMAVPVAGTIWEVFYQPAGESAGTAWALWGLFVGGVLLVLGVVLLQLQSLARGLRADLSVLVSMGESILNGENSGLSPGASVSLAQEPIRTMAGLARRPGGRRAKNTGPAKPANKVVAASVGSERDKPQTDTPGIGEEARLPVIAAASAFRAYDIRGVVDKDLSPEIATGLGWAFAEMATAQAVSKIYVAHDARLSSPELYESLCAGLADTGMRVQELGMAPAALLYYAMHLDPDAGAVLVTGSHNPPEYNGFKLYLRTEPVHGPALQELHLAMEKGGSTPRPGSREAFEVKQPYLEAVTQEVSFTRPLHVVVDGGNGVAGELACEMLSALGCEVTPLFCQPDGSFPNHHPDPSQVENLAALGSEVLSAGADVGIALDGDGDRIGMVDQQGQPVPPEHVLMLLAGDILRRHPGSDVIYDVKSSRQLAGFVLANGGRPIMWRSGHTRMKEKMRETGALLGGEFAGHIYIKERWYGSDDAVYVAARLLEVIADDPRPLHEQLAELPRSPSSPEYRLPLEEGESTLLMNALAAQLHFPDARIIDLDGLRVEFPHSWGLVRASNTVPSLTFRFEADDENELERIRQRFRDLLAQVAPEYPAPF